MQIEGRTYKFSANEEGFWSVPIVSRLPALGELVLRKEPDLKLTVIERRDLKRSVHKAISAATGTDGKLIGPKFALTGRGAPS